jgi:hypothetical protein
VSWDVEGDDSNGDKHPQQHRFNPVIIMAMINKANNPPSGGPVSNFQK